MRYLFCAYTTPGLLYPLVGLAAELHARGHEVAFVTGAAVEPVLAAAGIERVRRGEEDGESFRIERWGVSLAVAIDVKHIEYALRTFSPDVLIANVFALGAHIVAERCGIPVCVMGMAAYLWPRGGGTPEPFPDCASLARWRHAGMLEHLDAARAVFRLPPRDWLSERYPLLGDLFLVRSVPELETDPASLPPEVRLVGACEWEPAVDVNRLWREWSTQTTTPDPWTIYVHHGATFDEPGFWASLVTALSTRPVRVFASVGRMGRRAGILPPNFFVRDHIAHGIVLPHADLVVSGAHSAITLGALTHALPSVVLPCGGETPDNAARLERAGCAVRLDPRTATPDSLGVAIDVSLEDTALRANASRLREAFERLPGFRAAADAIELGLLASPRPPGRHTAQPHAQHGV